jgi:hypothetical protein
VQCIAVQGIVPIPQVRIEGKLWESRKVIMDTAKITNLCGKSRKKFRHFVNKK